MDFIITLGFTLIFLFAAILYVSIKHGSQNQEIDIELARHKIEMKRLKEQLRKKEILKEDYERLRKNLEEQHQKNMTQIYKSRVK